MTNYQLSITNHQLPITNSQTEAIKVNNLHKHYGKLAAVKGINFTVNKGEMFGLIGPDGAGKTTTFHILGGVMEATAGDVLVFGQPARDARLMTGYLTQQFSLYLDLSIDENLRYAGGLRQVDDDLLWERRHKYLTLMSLERFGSRLAGELSGGMKQKLALCCALVSQPEVLLLDEPTTGVDPVSRREFWDVLAELSAEGMTIVVATPYLDEAERCHLVALMYSGQIHEIGTPAALRNHLGLHRLEVKTANLEISECALPHPDRWVPPFPTASVPRSPQLDLQPRCALRAASQYAWRCCGCGIRSPPPTLLGSPQTAARCPRTEANSARREIHW